MSKRIIRALCLAALAVVLAAAQEVRLAAPISGAVFDAHSRSLRPVVGVPGAAYLGDALVSGLDLAVVSPDGKLALAVLNGKLCAIRGLDTLQIEWKELEGALEGVERIAWSGDAGAAAVYSPSSGRLQFWRDLAAQGTADLSGMSGRLAALAVDSSGRAAAAAFEAGGVWAISAGAEPRLLARMDHPAALALAGQDRDLFIADRAANEILLLRNYAQGGGAALFAAAPQGVLDPVAMAISPDGRSLVVASAEGRRLTAFNLVSAEVSGETVADFEPSRLERFSKSLFLLNHGGDGKDPLQVLDGSLGLSIYFVPAAAESGREE